MEVNTMVDTGRMPASDAVRPFPGSNTASVLGTINVYKDFKEPIEHFKEPINVEDYQLLQAESQSFSSNKSGHNRENPNSFKSRLNHKKRKHFLELSKKRSIQCYFDRHTYDFAHSSYHLDKRNKNNSLRLMRSQVRAPLCLMVVPALLHYLNIETLIVGVPSENTGKFTYLSIKFIHKEIVESLKMQNIKENISYEQIREQLKILELHGYITLEERKKLLPNGKWMSLSSIIRVTRKLFVDLGIPENMIDSALNKHTILQLQKEYAVKDKNKKETAKREIKKIRNIMTNMKDGKKISERDKDFLDKECPGHNRIRTTTNHYPDYTGIAKSHITKIETESSIRQIPKPVKELLASLLLKPETPH